MQIYLLCHKNRLKYKTIYIFWNFLEQEQNRTGTELEQNIFLEQNWNRTGTELEQN